MYRSGKNHPAVVCSFCGKPAERVEKMITGAGVQICSDCVAMCYRIIEEDRARAMKEKADAELIISQRCVRHFIVKIDRKIFYRIPQAIKSAFADASSPKRHSASAAIKYSSSWRIKI